MNHKRTVLNELGQPIGFSVGDWKAPPRPPRTPLAGRFVRLEPLDTARHGSDLHAANALDPAGAMWTYLPYGPFDSYAHYCVWLKDQERNQDPLFYTVIDLASEKAIGLVAYLRILPESGSIEVGHLNYSPLLQRTPAATEAMYLMMQRAFQLGYRRYEWKCDALNAKSRAAARRLGFSFEGVFRQATVYKARNRDTAWFAAIDRDWPALQQAFLRWLDSSNFDEHGVQRVPLSELTRPILDR